MNFQDQQLKDLEKVKTLTTEEKAIEKKKRNTKALPARD